MPEFVCQYGNCHETETPITLTIKGDPGDRVRFCSLLHLALWARKHTKREAIGSRDSFTPEDWRKLTPQQIDEYKELGL